MIAGMSGSGKSTFAKFLHDCLKAEYRIQSKVLAFADALKEEAVYGFDWDGEKDEKGRKLLQTLGSAGRAYDEDLWVNKLRKRILRYNPVGMELTDLEVYIIDDCRYENELVFADDMKDTWVQKILILRTDGEFGLSGEAKDHESEHGLDSVPLSAFDLAVENNSLGNLFCSADCVAEMIFNKVCQ